MDQAIAEHYLFATSFEDIGGAVRVANEQIDLPLKTNIYVVRMDWFNATAPLPVLHTKFLENVDNLSDLEQTIFANRVFVNEIAVNSPAQVKNLDNALIICAGGINKFDRRIANILQD